MIRFAIRRLLGLSMLLVALAGCRSKKLVDDPVENARLLEMVKKYEAVLEADINERQSWQLYNHVDEWWGTPYRLGGTTKKGIDCSGYAQHLYRSVYGIEIPRSTSEQVKKIKKVRQRKLKEGHLVFFDMDNKDKPTHVGIYLKNGRFAHASTSKGVRIDNLKQDYYRKRYWKGGKVKR